MLYTIVKKCSNINEEGEAGGGGGGGDGDINIQDIIEGDMAKMTPDQAKMKKRLQIKGKIQSVAKVSKMFTVLREE